MERASLLFAVVVALILPMACGLWLARRKNGYLKPLLLGVITFAVFQGAIRIPFITLVLSETAWYSLFAVTRPLLHALFLSSTAALFEEGGRWLVMSLFMKNRHRVADGIAFGVGHGGIEAMLLVGFSAAIVLVAGAQAPPAMQPLLGGLERLSAMTVHVALSVMVLRAVALRNPWWLILAFCLHTSLNLTAVLFVRAGAGAILVETLLAAFALVLLGYTVWEYQRWKGTQIAC